MRTTRSRTPTTSYKFKDYHKTTQPTRSSLRRVRTAQVVEGVLQLVLDAANTAEELLNFLSFERTRKHIQAGKHLPQTITRRAHVLQSKLESASICFQQGAKKETSDHEAAGMLQDLARTADEILQVVDSLAVFARGSITSRVALIQNRLQRVVTDTEAARFKLIPYTKIAAAVTLPTNPNIIAASPRALFHTEEDTALAPFLEKAQKRGWRVTEKQLAEATEKAVDSDLEESFDLLTRLQKPREGLLGEDVVVGVAKFPVISHSGRRLPESVIRECLHPALGYAFYLIFGAYTVIDNMCLLGIHESIMRVQGENNKPCLDVDKFVELHPYVKSEQSEWADILNQTHPVQPAKREGSHYYCPLVPHAITRKWGRGIGRWDFLAA